MHNKKLKTPDFTPGSFSDKASQFFSKDQEWTTEQNRHPEREERIQAELFKRTVTFAHHPNRYWIEQTAEESSALLRRTKLEHRMFAVALISATRQPDDRREFEKWYIIQPDYSPEKIMHFQHLVQSPDEEMLTGELEKNSDYALENGLYVPNHEDLDKLDSILELGYMDGYETLK